MTAADLTVDQILHAWSDRLIPAQLAWTALDIPSEHRDRAREQIANALSKEQSK
jgi:hypothetical protein